MNLPINAGALAQTLSSSPSILAIEHHPGEYRVDLDIHGQLPCFSGHFPGLPVVPGVAQLNWASEMAGVNLAQCQRVTAERLKFQKPMQPGQQVTLGLSAVQRGSAAVITFRFFNGAGLYSSGILIADPQDVSTLCCYSSL